MKKVVWALCLLLGSCSPDEPPAGRVPEAGERNETEEPGTSFETPELPAIVAPIVDGFDWVDYGPDAVKVQFRIHNAEECGMKSAAILYGVDAENLVVAQTDVYSNGMIVTTINKNNLTASRYLVACEITTVDMVYKTEYYSLSL